MTSAETNDSEVFAIVQQISSQIIKDRIQEITDKANHLDIKEKQLIVDLFGIALEKSHHILKNADRILLLLKKIATSANIVARSRIINSERITSDEEQSPEVYKVIGDPPGHVKVVRRGEKNTAQLFHEDLVTWAHLSHANILPVYGVHLEGEGGPISLVSPQVTKGNIIGHAKTLAQAARMPLISDIIEGLYYLHSLNIVHGTLNPQNVLVSHEGRALITGLDCFSDSESYEFSSIRYSAPEMLEDDAHPKMASDVWSLGCVIYELLSGKIPFYQIRNEVNVAAAVGAKKTPTRPSQGSKGVEEIGDTVWRPISTCWEFDAKDRPNCLQFQKGFSAIDIQDNRPVMMPQVKFTEGSAVNVEHARTVLTRINGSSPSMPPPSKVPEHLQKSLSELADSVAKAETVATAAKKLSPDDTQMLVDVLDLIIEENPSTLTYKNPVVILLRKIMMSTRIFPQRYKIKDIRHGSAPIAEGDFGRVYKGRDHDACINVLTRPGDISSVFEFFALWAHTSHPNMLPLYGVFYEGVNEPPQFCLVSPYLKNGLLGDYARRLVQKDRLPLISDVVNILAYKQGLDLVTSSIRGNRFLVSDEGHVLSDGFGALDIVTKPAITGTPWTSGPFSLRFYAPERAKNQEKSEEASIWSFGCLLYEVLSGKPPYYQYTDESDIRSALSRGELPIRPSATDDDMDEINDHFWDLIKGCCVLDPEKRLNLSEIQKRIADMNIQDNRPKETSLPAAQALALRSPLDINWGGVRPLLDQIQVELLRTPLSRLIQNHTKEVAAAALKLSSEDTRTLVDFLDLALKNHLTLSDERNRVLALLSRVTTVSHIFPRRYELKDIKYRRLPIAEGGYGTVHRGIPDPNLCIKVMTKVNSTVLMGFIKELILWAHASHPNVLPFYGVFVNESKRICLVSPFMNKGNLHDYAPRLAQKDRIPLLYDVIKGLGYLHGLGVVHTDLKGENVLISDEGHALITDFGASHVITTTARGGATTASVASTLRFTAPEIVLNRHSRPTQECDIWSFGCLCYEVLSRKLPYFEYNLEAQIYAALSRKQLPKRPKYHDDSSDDDEGRDEFDEPDWDEIDDLGWNLVTRCCTPSTQDRPKASRIQELIVDLKMWDVRPEAKDIFSAHMLSLLKSTSDVNLNRAGELLSQILVWLLARRTLYYRTEDVISAVTKLNFEGDDANALLHFWDMVLEQHFFSSDEHNQALALLSALVYSLRRLPYRHILPSTIRFHQKALGSGSFGTVHTGTDSKICVKVLRAANLDSGLDAQWLKAPAPSVYSSHPNVLPLYGIFFKKGVFILVSPFLKNGSLHDHALRLALKSRMLLICDVIEGLMYLHGLGVVHGNLKGENILISDEGRAVVADFRPYHANIAAAENGPAGPYFTTTLRFTAPELVKSREILPTVKSDIWSIGCLVYLVLSRKNPFYQYSKAGEIRSALSRGELLARPRSSGNGSDGIPDHSWDLITKCCALDSDDRLPLSDIRKLLVNLSPQDDRIPAKPFPGAEILKLRMTHFGVDVARAADAMARIISELPPIPQDGEKGDDSQDDIQLYK